MNSKQKLFCNLKETEGSETPDLIPTSGECSPYKKASKFAS